MLLLRYAQMFAFKLKMQIYTKQWEGDQDVSGVQQ